MAQLTRANFETELSARGWSRYATELERYLDWGLRDVVREARWKDLDTSGAVTSYGADSATESRIPFSEFSSGAVQTIKQVFLVGPDNSDKRKLTPMDEGYFMDRWVFQNMTLPENQGTPESYFVLQDEIWLKPAPDKDYHFSIHHTLRLTSFASDAATSGLPERFDEAILCAAEAYCFRRAHEFDRMAVSQSEMRRIVLAEMVDDGRRMEEQADRIIPYR